MEKIIKTLLVAMLAVSVGLVFWAVFTTPEDPTVENATAVGVYLYWGYALMAAAVVAALLGAAMDMFKAPSGVKRTIFSFVAIVALIVKLCPYRVATAGVGVRRGGGKPLDREWRVAYDGEGHGASSAYRKLKLGLCE